MDFHFFLRFVEILSRVRRSLPESCGVREAVRGPAKDQGLHGIGQVNNFYIC
jgi:hypothetical protein